MGHPQPLEEQGTHIPVVAFVNTRNPATGGWRGAALGEDAPHSVVVI